MRGRPSSRCSSPSGCWRRASPPGAGRRARCPRYLQFHWNLRCRMRAGSPPASPGPWPRARPGGCEPRWRGRCPERIPPSIRTSVSAWSSGRGRERGLGRAWANCATCWSSSIASPSPAPRGPMSRRWPRGRAAWPRSSPPELRPAVPARRPGTLAPVVVAADEATEPAVGDPHERRATGGGGGRASLDRAPPRHAAERMPGRVDHRRGGAPHRVGPLGDAQRGHLDRARHRHVEQHARRGLRPRQPHRCRQTDRDRIRSGTVSDRIGLVAFAAQALTQVPITTDYAVLEQALKGLHIGMLEDGTAIGTGIATAANRLRRAPGKSKVIVLLTDGVNNRGTVDPRTAAQAAAALGIKIYVIGVGKRGEAPVPTGQGLDGLRYEMMQVEIDEPLMTEIASMTGGRYFRATDAQSLRNIFAEINRC